MTDTITEVAPVDDTGDIFTEEAMQAAEQTATEEESKLKVTVHDVDEAPFGRNSDGVRLDKHGQPAPHGLKKDGTAAKKRGRQAGSESSGRSISRPKGKAKTAVDYRPGIHGILQLPVGIMTGIGLATGNDTMLADGTAISLHAPPIAEALNDLAQENAQVAGVLERMMQVGPYGALIAAVMPLCAQIATNHKMLPISITGGMGAYPPEALIASAKEDIERMRQAAEGKEAA